MSVYEIAQFLCLYGQLIRLCDTNLHAPMRNRLKYQPVTIHSLLEILCIIDSCYMMHNQFYLGSLNSIFLVEEGVDWGREDADRTSHDNPLCVKVLDL